MAAVTICSDFGAKKNKACHCLHCFPIYLSWSDRTKVIQFYMYLYMCVFQYIHAYTHIYTHIWGFLGVTSGKEPACQCRRLKRHGFNPWVRKIPWRRAQQPTPIHLPGESHGQRSLVKYSPWCCKGLDTTEWRTLTDWYTDIQYKYAYHTVYIILYKSPNANYYAK